MTYASILWRIEFRAFLALAVSATLVGLYLDIASEAKAIGWYFGTSIFLIGLVPVVFFGAPIDSYLLYRSRASWLLVLIVGAIPAIPIALFSTAVASLIRVCGLLVAAITHGLVLARPLTMNWSGP